eukprot:CAMPEP_0194438972 /NCGR_PEP_ID=MMETSP0176-20130528/107778_1 /TAXON_ID=216777 /ORGANISM="Proboscia alata, Strain PI-D3" /LENGTH=435 /DNA_ID=CAMNT_0039261667 /DNA_START=45 /DNA_END=1352 /DNA_ORIENTATION=+
METSSPINRPSEGSLLLEENINLLSPLPSVLELCLADAALKSGKNGLVSCVASAAKAALKASENNSSSTFGKMSKKVNRCVGEGLKKYSDEVCMLVTCFIEMKCLNSSSCASLSETVYGMKRAKVLAQITEPNSVSGQEFSLHPLSRKDKMCSLATLVIIPYLKQRLDKTYEKLRDFFSERRDGGLNAGSSSEHSSSLNSAFAQYGANITSNNSSEKTVSMQKLKWYFVRVYPYLHMTNEGLNIAYQWAYLFGRTAHYNSSLHLIGQILRRVTQSDRPQKSATNHSLAVPRKKSVTNTPVGSTAQVGIAAGVASILVISWLVSLKMEIRKRRKRLLEEFAARNFDNDVFSIPPPQPPKLGMNTNDLALVQLPSDKSLCPLCKQSIVNPVAATSGYVFCYRCIVMHVRQHGTCPISGMSCSESRIIPLYETSAIVR